MDCTNDIVSAMFTDAHLKAIGTAIVAIVSAAALLAGAYVARIINKWRKWEQ